MKEADVISQWVIKAQKLMFIVAHDSSEAWQLSSVVQIFRCLQA